MSGNNNQTSASGNGGKNAFTREASSRVQSTQAKGGHDTGSGTFAARAQAAGDKNANAGAQGRGGKK